MLDFIRNHKGLMMVCLVLFMVPGLGLVGIQGFHSFFSQDANVARVNGQPISRQEYEATLRDVLNQIQQRLISAEARRERLIVSDQAVRRTILSIPAIASLIQSDGSIDAQQYRKL